MAYRKDIPDKKTAFGSNQAGARIIKVAALCFAILSWYATAEGLHMYVFSHMWQAQLISFGVQGILFILNLKLPYYFRQIGLRESSKKFFNTALQLTLLGFYILAIAFSSCFSFVFIADSVIYEHDSGYVDANTVLSNSYRSILDNTESYITENIKATQTVAGKQLAELQAEMGINTGDGAKSLEELETAVAEANTEYENADIAVETAKEKCASAKEYLDSLYDGRFIYPEEYRRAQEAYNEALDALAQAKKVFSAAETKLESAQTELADWEKSDSAITGTFLAELLSDSPNPVSIENSMRLLTGRITEMGDSGSIPANFTAIVQKTQALRTTLQQYLTLREAFSDDSGSGALEELSAQSIAAPSPDSPSFTEDKHGWQNYWQQRYSKLKEQLQQLPAYSSTNTGYLDGSLIDIDLLESYDKNQLIAEIDNLVRQHTTDINVIERAVYLLWGEYPFTAWFSLSTAVFLDLSSLLAGLFLYGMSGSKSNKKPTADYHAPSPVPW